MIRLLVTGGRSITREQCDALRRALDLAHLRITVDVLIHGACFDPVQSPSTRDRWSADAEAGRWAREHGIHVMEYPPIKRLDGPWPGAGPRRNIRMIRDGRPTHWIASAGGKGTAHCVYELMRANVCKVVDLREAAATNDESPRPKPGAGG